MAHKYTEEELIDELINFKITRGFWPSLRDMGGSVYPSRSTYSRRFASGYDRLDGFGIAIEMAKTRYLAQMAFLNRKDGIITRFIGGIKKWLSI